MYKIKEIIAMLQQANPEQELKFECSINDYVVCDNEDCGEGGSYRENKVFKVRNIWPNMELIELEEV